MLPNLETGFHLKFGQLTGRGTDFSWVRPFTDEPRLGPGRGGRASTLIINCGRREERQIIWPEYLKITRTSIPKSNPQQEEGLLSFWLGPGWGGRASTLIINCGSWEERWIIWPEYLKNTRTSIPKSNPKREEGLLSVWLGPGWGGRASTLIINCGSREERWIIWPDYLKITRTSSPKSNPQLEEGLLSVWLGPGRGGRASTLTINCGSREERLWHKIKDFCSKS